MTENTTPAADEAQRIWDELDAQDAGKTPVDTAPEPEVTESAPQDAKAPEQGDAPVSAEQQWLDKIAGLETQLSQMHQRLRNAEGHIGGLNSQLKQAQTQVKAEGGDAPTASEIREAQKSPKAMEELRRDYPEFAKAMEDVLQADRAELNSRLAAMERRVATTQALAQPGISAADLQRVRAEVQVDIRHPGWQEKVARPEFTGWLVRQPREVQMLAASESPQDATRLLDIYSDATTATTTQRNQRLSAAAAIPAGRAGGSPKQKSLDDMTPQELWAYMDAKEAAENKGR